MTDDTIPTGDPTTVPIGELEELVKRWEEAAEYADENATVGEYDGIMGCKDELQTLINEHDPKQ